MFTVLVLGVLLVVLLYSFNAYGDIVRFDNSEEEKKGNIRIEKIACDTDTFEYLAEIVVEGNIEHDFEVEIEVDGEVAKKERITEGVIRAGARDGEHNVKLRVDTRNEVDEWDENDNEREERVYCELKKPDFYIESIELEDEKYKIRIGNAGEVGGKIEAKVEIDGEEVGYELSKDFIEAGEKIDIFVDARDGEHEIKVRVDPDDKIKEKDEGNNEKTERIKAIVLENAWTLTIRPGWNFIAPFMFMNQERIKTDCGNMEEFGILMWMPEQKRFMSIYDVMIETMMKFGGNEEKAKEAMMKTVIRSGLWVYSEKICHITSEAKRMPIGFTIDVTPGWNILPLMGNISFLSLADISGDCGNIIAYKWDSLNQRWERIGMEYVFRDEDTFLALAIKVNRFCKIGRILKPPEFPKG